MKVTITQIDNRAETLPSTMAALKAHIAQYKSDFVLLPEMCFSPWLAVEKTPDPKKWAAAIDAHETYINTLSDLNVSALISTRPMINQTGSWRNQAFLWTKEMGVQGIREKYYLPDCEGYWENSWYDRGAKNFTTIRGGGARIGVQICTEMWFFDMARHYAKSRAEIICVPRATERGSLEKWQAGGVAAAVCSGAFCLSSNLWTPASAPVDCGGLGWAVDPDGKILAQTSEDAPFKTIDIDLAHARDAKGTYPRYVRE